MNLTMRKKRPIKRNESAFRDDRLFIVACDDRYAPKQYFDSFEIPRVHVHVVPTEDGRSGAEHVLKRLLAVDKESDDELWLVLDTDHYIKREHLKTFTRVLQEAKQNNIRLALSRSCFEVWLLLHHVDPEYVVPLKNATQVAAALRKVLGEYDKTNLDGRHFTLDGVAAACRRAELLDAQTPGGDIPSGNTSRVYLLWKSIARKALQSQLPPQLKALY